jgi:hypothetical protein
VGAVGLCNVVLARALVVKAAPVLWIVRRFLPLPAGVESSAPGPPYSLSYHHLGLICAAIASMWMGIPIRKKDLAGGGRGGADGRRPPQCITKSYCKEVRVRGLWCDSGLASRSGRNIGWWLLYFLLLYALAALAVRV